MLWQQTWHRNDEAVPWFTLTQSSGEHAIPVPERYWVFSPPKDIVWALELNASSVLVREDYTRALYRLFESSGWSDFHPLAYFTILFPKQVPHSSVPKLGSFLWGIPEVVCDDLCLPGPS